MNDLEEQLEEEIPPLGVRVRGWLTTRDYLRLFLGLPSVLALAVLLAYGVFLYGWKPAHAESRCYTMAGRAYEGQDYETARVVYQSLLRLGGKQRQEYAFKLMLCQRQLGQNRAAAMLASALAPLTGLGYAPAHLLVAKELLSATNGIGDPDQLNKMIISHLERASQGDPSNPEVQQLLGNIYVSWGMGESAKPYLLQLAKTNAQAMVWLAITSANV